MIDDDECGAVGGMRIGRGIFGIVGGRVKLGSLGTAATNRPIVPAPGDYDDGEGHAVAQAISRWLPTVAARVCARAACGVCGGQSSTGAGFLRVLRLPLPVIPPISPSS
jgi:hypothetical protein